MSIPSFQIANAISPGKMEELHAEISIQNCSFHDTGVFAEIYSQEVGNSSDVDNWELLNNKTMELWANGSAHAVGGAIGILFQVSPPNPSLGIPSKFAVEIADTDFVNTAAGSNSILFPEKKWSYNYGGGAVFLYSSMKAIDSVVFRSVEFSNCT